MKQPNRLRLTVALAFTFMSLLATWKASHDYWKAQSSTIGRIQADFQRRESQIEQQEQALMEGLDENERAEMQKELAALAPPPPAPDLQPPQYWPFVGGWLAWLMALPLLALAAVVLYRDNPRGRTYAWLSGLYAAAYGTWAFLPDDPEDFNHLGYAFFPMLLFVATIAALLLARVERATARLEDELSKEEANS